MKMIRKIGKVVFGVLFPISLTITLFLFFAYKVTSFDFLQVLTYHFSNYFINKTTVEETYDAARYYCKIYNKSFQIPLKEFSFNESISCDEINKIEKDKFGTYIIGKVLKGLYNRKIYCEGIRCYKNPKNIISRSFNMLAFKFFVYSAVVTSVFLLIYMLLLNSWKERFRNLSAVLFSISIPYFVIIFYIRHLTFKYVPIVLFILESFHKIFLYVMVAATFFAVLWLTFKFKRK